jgi:hypothetical protein
MSSPPQENRSRSHSQHSSWTYDDLAKLSNAYTSVSIHIALERADMNEDWEAFEYILKKSPGELMNHLKILLCIYEFNFFELDKNHQNEILTRAGYSRPPSPDASAKSTGEGSSKLTIEVPE